jgi:hypothetical protein
MGKKKGFKWNAAKVLSLIRTKKMDYETQHPPIYLWWKPFRPTLEEGPGSNFLGTNLD